MAGSQIMHREQTRDKLRSEIRVQGSWQNRGWRLGRRGGEGRHRLDRGEGGGGGACGLASQVKG